MVYQCNTAEIDPFPMLKVYKKGSISGVDSIIYIIESTPEIDPFYIYNVRA